MKTLMMALVSLVSAISVNAQVQVTAETMGKGKVAAFVSTNAIAVRDFTTISFSNAQLWYGVTNRLDVFAGVSETVLLGQKQTAAAVGGNVNLLKSKAISVSLFDVLSPPLNRRADSCGATWFTAVVVSKNVTIGNLALTPYSGYAVTVPVGQTRDKLFSPPEPRHNIPLGVMIPKGKWALFAEYDFGRKQQIGGIGVAFTF